jgi:U3 small nucleolar RNA-associated protein 3
MTVDGLEEDPFYEEAKRLSEAAKKEKQQKKKNKDKKSAMIPMANEEQQPNEGGKRVIDSTIASNRGLTKNRNKKFTHAKTKYRHKHEQAMKKRKGQVPTMRTQDTKYGGETTGIKSNIIRSRKLH